MTFKKPRDLSWRLLKESKFRMCSRIKVVIQMSHIIIYTRKSVHDRILQYVVVMQSVYVHTEQPGKDALMVGSDFSSQVILTQWYFHLTVAADPSLIQILALITHSHFHTLNICTVYTKSSLCTATHIALHIPTRTNTRGHMKRTQAHYRNHTVRFVLARAEKVKQFVVVVVSKVLFPCIRQAPLKLLHLGK